jgi:hypothetical protein
VKDTVRIPDDWQSGGLWYLVEKPSDEDGFQVEVGPTDASKHDPAEHQPDELALLARMRYEAYVTTRLGAGNFALMVAGALAKATGGIVVEYQGAASVLGDYLGAAPLPKAGDGKPGLAERGYYDAPLAWAIAKAAAANERGEKPGAPAKSGGNAGMTWGAVILGIFAVGAIFKLVRQRKEREK